MTTPFITEEEFAKLPFPERHEMLKKELAEDAAAMILATDKIESLKIRLADAERIAERLASKLESTAIYNYSKHKACWCVGHFTGEHTDQCLMRQQALADYDAWKYEIGKEQPTPSPAVSREPK